MQSVLSLRETFERYAKSKSLRTNLEVGDQGVLLGADTLVLEIEKQGKHRPSDFADLRLLALLSVAYKRRVESGAVTNIRQAVVYWVAAINLLRASIWPSQTCRDWKAAKMRPSLRRMGKASSQSAWWFYEQSSANYAREVFKDADLLDQIIIRQLDYPGDARWPYPASAPWAKGKQKP